VYALPPDPEGNPVYGFTRSAVDYIRLNSLIVRDACKRLTTSAHELFHRVQYTYGYEDGPAGMDWLVEGTACWAKKFTNNGIKDYLDEMNNGLHTPNKDLIRKRSYDACHLLWVHLQERATSTAIREIWAADPKSRKTTKTAVNNVLKEKLRLTFDQFVREWHIANFAKDLQGIEPWYEYADDECQYTNPCGVYYPGLDQVPTSGATINPASAPFVAYGLALPYGADYYVFDLDPSITNLEVKLNDNDTASFSYYLVAIKNNMKEQDYTFN
jgi:hypothetical protein